MKFIRLVFECAFIARLPGSGSEHKNSFFHIRCVCVIGIVILCASVISVALNSAYEYNRTTHAGIIVRLVCCVVFAPSWVWHDIHKMYELVSDFRRACMLHCVVSGDANSELSQLWFNRFAGFFWYTKWSYSWSCWGFIVYRLLGFK